MYFCTVVSIEAQGGDASKRRNTPDVENVGSKTGLRAGDRHIKKALSQRLICGTQNLANSKPPQDKAMFNVHGFVYSL